MKIKIKTNILLLFTLFSLFICLPSDDIWNSLISKINNRKIILKDKKTHFIYDESNYTKLDINSTKMNYLYQKQEDIFSKYNISNYIFIVDHLNENPESIEDATFNLCRYLSNYFNISMAESVVALFSMETRRVRIRTGEITKESITDDEAEKMIDNLGSYLRGQKYYEAWIKLIEDIDYYYNKYSLSSILQFLIMISILFGIGLFFFIVMLIYEGIKKCRSLPDDTNLKKIVRFLKAQKSNKKIFTENCAICLEKFIIKIEMDIEEKNSNRIKLKDDKFDISTLDCGHQFHTNCIARWMEKKNDCPLCRQKINPKYNQSEAKMVWGVQNELYDNNYNNINYNHIYTRDFYVPSNFSSSNNYSSNYNFGGGGCDCGGGATGGW